MVGRGAGLMIAAANEGELIRALVVAGHSTATIAEPLAITTRAVELRTTLSDRAGVERRAARVAAVLAP